MTDAARRDGEPARRGRPGCDRRGLLDASVATRLRFGMVNSLVEWYRPGGAEDADALARDVLTVALDGLRTR